MLAIAPESTRESTTLLLDYYGSGDASDLSAWLSDHAVERLPGGLTIIEQRERNEARAQSGGPDESRHGQQSGAHAPRTRLGS